MENDYFVKVDQHSDVLKKTLQGSKKAIECSQSYYKLLEIRREKSEAFALLKAQAVELLQYSKFLEEELPYHDLIKKKTSTKKKATTKKSTTKKGTKKSATKKTTTKKRSKSSDAMSKLADSLAAIEEKLQSLE